MANANDTASMALFCDFENVALGVRDAQYEKLDIRPVLERLLAKGSIVVKKAYCDWDRYKAFKAAMHEANFELIEIPHVRQSGKNSADIRMVVDALDLCYTKSHVDTFVIISGDSDFSPLVSKLRENAKKVIGVGVKQSCSDLLVTNCDEFIYYDDLVRDRESSRTTQRREREKRSPEEEARRREKQEERKSKAVDLVSATLADLIADRGEAERVWASVLKEVVKRRNPGFSEGYFGFRTFGNLLEEAAARGLLVVGRDDKSGTYVTRSTVRVAEASEGEAPASLPAESEALVTAEDSAPVALEAGAEPAAPAASDDKSGRRRGGRRGRKDGRESKDSKDSKDGAAPVLAAPVAADGDPAESVVALAPIAVDAPEVTISAEPSVSSSVPGIVAAGLNEPAPTLAVDPPPAEKKPRGERKKRPSKRDAGTPGDDANANASGTGTTEATVTAKPATRRRQGKAAVEQAATSAGQSAAASTPAPDVDGPAATVDTPVAEKSRRGGRRPRKAKVTESSGE
jgi:uncharacterized protein (TIGR00288 family)